MAIESEEIQGSLGGKDHRHFDENQIPAPQRGLLDWISCSSQILSTRWTQQIQPNLLHFGSWYLQEKILDYFALFPSVRVA